MADDNRDKRLKDNAGKQLDPKNSRHEDRAPPGSVGNTPRGLGGPSPGSRPVPEGAREYMTLGKPENQRGQRDFSRENQLGAQMRGEKDKQNTLSKEFGKSAPDSKDRGHER